MVRLDSSSSVSNNRNIKADVMKIKWDKIRLETGVTKTKQLELWPIEKDQEVEEGSEEAERDFQVKGVEEEQ